MYPLLTKLATDVNTLSDAALKILMGELINLQMSRTGESTLDTNNGSDANNAPQTPLPAKRQRKNPPTTAFEFTRGGALKYISVPILVHESYKTSFTEYHRKIPYIGEICEAMGKSKESPAADHDVGAEKLLLYLAKNHAQEYIKVGKKNGRENE